MKYDSYYCCFKCDVKMKPECKFKFIINHQYCTSPKYMLSIEKHGITNNIFCLIKNTKPIEENCSQCLSDFKRSSIHTQMQMLQFIKSSSLDNNLIDINELDISKLTLPIRYSVTEKKPTIHTKKSYSKEEDYYLEMALGNIPTDLSTQASLAKQIKFICGVSIIKRDDKTESEDSCFTTEYCIGLADGVGGWAEYGISSAAFSHELMDECCKISQEQTVDPITLLSQAYSKIQSFGSSTAVICTSEAGQLSICNLGDSGFMHMKFLAGKPFIVQRSQPQQHDFNIPYQLSKIPTEEYMMKRAEQDERMLECANTLKECSFCQDAPESADYFQLANASSGDLLILASDGVFDNLFDTEILEVVTKMYQKANTINVTKLARKITTIAYNKSKMVSEVESPFNEKLEQHSHIICDGGKEDDISVVIALLA